jgi:hypothetical protein
LGDSSAPRSVTTRRYQRFVGQECARESERTLICTGRRAPGDLGNGRSGHLPGRLRRRLHRLRRIHRLRIHIHDDGGGGISHVGICGGVYVVTERHRLLTLHEQKARLRLWGRKHVLLGARHHFPQLLLCALFLLGPPQHLRGAAAVSGGMVAPDLNS